MYTIIIMNTLQHNAHAVTILLHNVYTYISFLQTAAWIGTGILTIMAAVHFILVAVYIIHCHQQGRESSVPYSHLEVVATDLEESKTEKAIAV